MIVKLGYWDVDFKTQKGAGQIPCTNFWGPITPSSHLGVFLRRVHFYNRRAVINLIMYDKLSLSSEKILFKRYGLFMDASRSNDCT